MYNCQISLLQPSDLTVILTHGDWKRQKVGRHDVENSEFIVLMSGPPLVMHFNTYFMIICPGWGTHSDSIFCKTPANLKDLKIIQLVSLRQAFNQHLGICFQLSVGHWQPIPIYWIGSIHFSCLLWFCTHAQSCTSLRHHLLPMPCQPSPLWGH